MDTAGKLKFYYERLSELYRLGCIGGVLGWDESTYMPPLAAEARASQHEYVASKGHALATDPEFLKVVDELAEAMDQLGPDDRVNVRESKRELDRQRKLPPEWVKEMVTTSSLAFNVWRAARPKNDWAAVKPYLEKMLVLNRQKCELIGYKEHPYDAVLDIHEPGAKTSTVKPLLLGLGEKLREIIPPITEKFQNAHPPSGKYPEKVQYELSRKIAGDLGFSFEMGRLDTAPHPFSTTLGPQDHRITTRYDEGNFLGCLYSVIHEVGHALYEMGLPVKWAGTPLASASSLGIHESQSRLWENQVGRSREFSQYLSGVLQQFFPDDPSLADPESLWYMVNHVSPSLIRTEADEVTYSQHIVIRMLLEEQMILGQLTIEDLPEAWNDHYEKYLGVRPHDYKDGVMQDTHWFGGSVGYFPTYALGNLYNAMMMKAARAALPGLPEQIKRGEFAPLLAWLRENVHQYGSTYHGPELIKRITGQELSAEPFVDYLKAKFLS